eukprot:TRINITY_DN3412_c0_g1_i1.p1 TRINITY_DN3412_c0_g1~~TRINITY_DN3412_c0_g1_i1.p1  ORF type:complete len:412 (-),score=37.51 TRINITY_DN3412_c0_g1_i1:1270-2505(-)
MTNHCGYTQLLGFVPIVTQYTQKYQTAYTYETYNLGRRFPFLAIPNSLRDITWIHWILMCLAVDFSFYWWHRFSHSWNVLWATHGVHHSSEEYNLSTALRQPFLDPVFKWAFYWPFALVFPVPLFVFHTQWNTLSQFIIHTRTVGRFPWLIELIFNTPSHHRVHHGQNPKYIDKNFGGIFIIFDRLFGTYEEEDEPVVYGVTNAVASWNPFYIQFYQFGEIWQTMRQTPGVLNKLRVWLDRGPAYNYAVLYPDKCHNPAPPITVDTQLKYDAHAPNPAILAYATTHGIAVFGAAIYAINPDIFPVDAPLEWLVTCTAFVLVSMWSVSLLFDAVWYAPYVEVARNAWWCTIVIRMPLYGSAHIGFAAMIHSEWFVWTMVTISACSVLWVSVVWWLVPHRPMVRFRHALPEEK